MAIKGTQKIKTTDRTDKRKVRQHKLNSLKNEFESGKIKDFSQVFALFNRSPLAREIGVPFYSFKSKVSNPGDFTINELIRFARLIDVNIEIILAFIFDQIAAKTNGRKVK